jgi:hypothetical protein
MTEGTAKAPRSIHTARSQAGWHMGSITCIQSLVGRLIGSVQIAYERMDFVQAGGMLRRVPLEQAANHMRQRYLRDNAGVDGRDKKRPFPPPPHRSVTGTSHNFSQPFLGLVNFSSEFSELCTLAI